MKVTVSKIKREGKDTGLRSTKKGGVKVKKDVFYNRKSVRENIEKLFKGGQKPSPSAA